jgi:hypothetical protein
MPARLADYAEFRMQVQVKYNNATLDIKLPGDAKVEMLQKEVSRLFAVPQEAQRIIFRGRPISGSTVDLAALNIVDGARLLLLASKPVDKTVGEDGKRSSLFPNMQFVNQRRSPTFVPDPVIVEKGPPPGAIRPYSAQTDSLPKEPFVVRTPNGIAKLHIESDAIFVECEDGTNRRFFFSSLTGQLVRLGNGEYFAVRAEEKEVADLYFIPSQYRDVLTRIMRS